MAEFTCRNYGNCSYADNRRPFVVPDSGVPVCPGCGSGAYLKPVSGKTADGVTLKTLLIAVAVLIAVALAGAGIWYALQPGAEAPASGPQISQAPEPTAAPAPTPTPLPEPQAPPRPAPTAEVPVHPDLFGVIEIGGKGVKGVVVDLVKAEADPNCQKDEEVFAGCLIRAGLEPHNVNPVNEGAIADTVQAAKATMDRMVAEFTVDPGQIYVVGSSGVAQTSHKEALRVALEKGLNKSGRVGFVTADEEAGYAFQGVLNLVPPQWRERRSREAMVLDIGSGNTKGAYNEFMGAEQRLITFGFPWGTKTYSDAVDQQRAGGSFTAYSAKLRNSLLRPAIREIVGRKQGIASHSRIYLVGGLPWAVTTLIQPGNTQHFPRFYPAHVNTLRTRVITPGASRRICDENPDRRISRLADEDIGRVCQAFSIDNLTAGLDLLSTLSEEMKFQDKTIFFMRDSLYLWPLGYLKVQCKADQKC